MRTVWIRVELPEEQANILESPQGVAMVVPMLSAEVEPLRMKLNGLAAAIVFFKRGFATLRQVIERDGDRDRHVSGTLEKMAPAVSDAEILIDDLRVVIGRATFIGKIGKEPTQ